MSSQMTQSWRDVTQSNQPFSPEKNWEELNNGSHKLSMKLQGFSKDQLRINLNTSSRTLIVTGMKTDGFNVTRLNERIQLKETCSLDGVSAKLFSDTLSITFPKKQ